MKRPSSSACLPAASKRKRGMENKRRVQIFVVGKVQGVYYRESSKLMGAQLGLSGAAWNLKDGRVELLAEGTEDKLKELIQWCWKGPEGAEEVGIKNKLTARRNVTDVQVEWCEAHGDLPLPFQNAGKK
eukprot:TRINITY_DN12338_c0_g1_i2.p1 TRINITY_DN12338_c0_g1~~TRINITY_DN12338_c0_g1_i2.p1  ORF type:complete len:129 (-),score=25.65 TRINITY_DN12338_c0_g1_i2:181-567(-)